MSVVRSVFRPAHRHVRVDPPVRVGRLGLLFAVVVALVGGLMSGVAHADDTGGFTPVDFSQAPPPPQPPQPPLSASQIANGTITLNGTLGAFPLSIADQAGNTQPVGTYPPSPFPALGQAHLFSQTSGLAPMTADQYAAMIAMENDAVAAVMNLHGISNTPQHHDLVIRYDREDVTAALYARLRQGLDDPTRTADEQNALRWLVAVGQAHQVGVAQEALNQFNLWYRNPCTYHPPAPYRGDYDISQNSECTARLYGTQVPPVHEAPDASSFEAWGAAVFDAQHDSTGLESTFKVSASEAAIAFGTGGAVLGAGSAAGIAASVLLPPASNGVSGLVDAIAPNFAGLISRALAQIAEFSADLGAEGVTTALSSVARFTVFANIGAVLGPALIIVGALVQLILAGISTFKHDRVQSSLQDALDSARSTEPQIRDLMNSTDGAQQVFYDLAGSVLPCVGDKYTDPAQCYIADNTPPQRRVDDPVFRTVDEDSGQVLAGPTPDVPVSLGIPGHVGDTTLSIRDGWFVIGDDPDPQQTLRYVDDRGVGRTLRLLRTAANTYVFQSLVTPTGDSVANTGFDPTTAHCGSQDIHGPCWVGTELDMLDSTGRHVALTLAPDRAPTGEIISADRSATVGVPVTFTAALPANTPADPDGNSVTQHWSAELDVPCVISTVANYNWNCGNGGTHDGPHGGYDEPVPDGSTATLIWNHPGTYRVTRTVTDSLGLSTTSSMDVVVAPARRALFAACLQCDTTAGRQVQIAGRLNTGVPRNDGTISIDWGDGTTTVAKPTDAQYGRQFVTSTFWATIENSAQYQFQAVHTYAAGSQSNQHITVSTTDAADSDLPPVTLAADIAPVADPTSYGDIVSDRLADYEIPVRLPLFVDGTGNRLTPTCTAPDGYGGTQTVYPLTPFRTGMTFLVTCTATAASGLSTTVTFSVTTHQIHVTVVPSATSTDVGTPVTFTAHGTTDDGRDVGDVTDRVELEYDNQNVQCARNVCTRTTPGPIEVYPVVDDASVGDPATASVAPGTPFAITVTAGGDQNVAVNSPVPNGWTFVVRDEYGNPVPNVPVQVAVVSGKGTVLNGLTSQQLVSDGAGQVQVGGSVGGTPGAVVFRATVNQALTAQFTAHAVAGPGLRGVSGNAQRARVGSTPVPLVTKLLDSGRLPLSGQPISVTVIRGPARMADGSTKATGTTDAYGRFSAALAPATTPGTSLVNVTAGDQTLLQLITYVANAAPTADPDTYTVVARTGPIAATTGNGALHNDVDPDGDALAAVLRTRPTHGVLDFGRNGSFTYTPKGDFTGTDSFTYVTTDGLLTTAPQTVTLTVLPASADVAVARNIPAQVARGSTFTLGVAIQNNGPSTTRTVTVTTTLPRGLTFGAVPAGVRLSADHRTATYKLSGIASGATAAADLTVAVAANAKPAVVQLTTTASAPDTADVNPANNVQTTATQVT